LGVISAAPLSLVAIKLVYYILGGGHWGYGIFGGCYLPHGTPAAIIAPPHNGVMLLYRFVCLPVSRVTQNYG